MRWAAFFIVSIFAFVASPAASQVAPPSGDAAYAQFEAAVEQAKAAMMADPGQALGKADAAIARASALAPSQKASVALATAQWLKAEAYLGINEPDKARAVVDQALALLTKVAPGSKLEGDLMRSRGAVAAIGGHAQEALADFQKAHDIFRAIGQLRSQAIALQDIGQIYWDAGDYARTLEYYSQASELYTADPAFNLTSHNSRAEVLRKLRRFEEAEREYREALKSARTLGSALLQVRVLSNLAASQVEHGKLAEADRSVREALRMSRSGEAAGWKPFVLGAAAKVAATRGDLDRAAALLRQTFAGTDLATTPLPFREFHEVAASVFEKRGEERLALAHLKAFQRLDSEARNLTASTSSQLMAARFDFQNQKQKIVERDARIAKQQAEFRSTVLIGLIIASGIVLVLVLVSAMRIRRSRDQVRAANVVLAETNVALEKALKAKTEFLATTSHEIRTPLNGILGMTQILLAGRKLDGETREQVEVVHGAGEAMRALVDDILDVAKMETGDVTVAREDVAFRSLLEDAARLWSGHAAAKGVELRVDLARAPVAIRSDGARLRQVIGNLLSNAVKFTSAGSIELRAFATEDETSLVIQVQDSGIGIPDDHRDLVFDAFHQVDGGTNRQFSGTGLGLSICHNLVAAMGGEILLETAVGTGSTFTVRLPLERLDAADSVETPAERPTSLSQARLLLVEANAMTAGILQSILEPVAGSVECVTDGSAAIAAVRAGTADHLLVEARSSEIPGTEPMAALRAVVDACREAGVAVSLLVAPSDEYPLGDVAQLGATQLIVKPVAGLQLIGALNAAYEPPGETSLLSSAA